MNQDERILKNRNYLLDLARSLAICAVVLFHYDPSIFPLGYLGVDIFFVLSGFLFNKTFLSANIGERITLIGYYIKRFWRIFPSLVLMVLLSCVASFLLLLPHDLVEFSKSAIASIFAVSNIIFWRSADYFSTGALYKPLLHTWSLGVEEQFYLIIPLFVVAFRSRLKHALALLLVTSFCFDIWLKSHGGTSPAFYLMPTRVWQFLLGFFAFDLSSRLRYVKIISVAPAILFILLLISVFFEIQFFENKFCNLTILLTFLLLSLSSCFKIDHKYIKVLNPIVYLSKISFSIYLYHWPVIVFINYISPDGLTQIIKFSYFPLTFAFAILNYEYIENVFRSSSYRKFKTLLLIIGASVTIALPAYAITSEGMPSRFANSITLLNNAAGDNYRCPIQNLSIESYGRVCKIRNAHRETKPEFAVFGNSHSQMYYPLITSVVNKAYNVVLYPMNGCIPSALYNLNNDCFKTAHGYIDHIIHDSNISFVLIGTTYSNLTLQDKNGTVYDDATHEKLYDAIISTVDTLQSAGKSVAIIGPLAMPGIDIPTDYARMLALGKNPFDFSKSDSSGFYAEFGKIIQRFESKGIILIRPDQVQCYSDKCVNIVDGYSLFSDNNHLSQQMLSFFQQPFQLGVYKLLRAR